MTEQSTTYKVLILGDSSVGKTSLLIRFIDGRYDDSGLASIGMDLKIKFLKHKDRKIQLELWDTAGQERFHCITKNYFKGTDGIIILYDITNRTTYLNVKNWMTSIKETLNLKDLGVVLCGNKCDCDDSERNVTYEDGKKIADNYGVDFMETSSKDDINVNQAFISLIEGMMKAEERNKDKSTRKRSSSRLEKKSTEEVKEKHKKECGC